MHVFINAEKGALCQGCATLAFKENKNGRHKQVKKMD